MYGLGLYLEEIDEAEMIGVNYTGWPKKVSHYRESY